MRKARFSALNTLALTHLGRHWVDYIASNTMTEFNRRQNDFIWTYDLKALIVGIKDEAPGVKTFTLLPNQHWRHVKAGQHIAVTAQVNGQAVTRFYSLSPLVRGRFTITVKRVEGGVLSNWLHDHAQTGQALSIQHPQGDFCYQQQRKVLFICAGSGITPCYSIITDRLAAASLEGGNPAPDMAIYAQFSTKNDLIFAEALASWSARLSVRTAFSRDNASALIKAAPLLQQYPDLNERDVYLCGPQGFMDEVIGMLTAEGYDMSRLHCERFAFQDDTAANPSEFETAGAEIYFQHLDTRITLAPDDKGKTLMDLAESHGVNLEVGCRQGMCGTCKLTLKSGQVSGNVLGQAVYLCSAYPASRNLVLDA